MRAEAEQHRAEVGVGGKTKFLPASSFPEEEPDAVVSSLPRLLLQEQKLQSINCTE